MMKVIALAHQPQVDIPLRGSICPPSADEDLLGVLTERAYQRLLGHILVDGGGDILGL